MDRHTPRLAAVTGALGYSGRAITQRLLALGWRVRTLTNSPDRPNPFGGALDIRPLAFEDPGELAESLRGCGVLVNTYWVRFNHRNFTHARAVENTRTLFRAARAAGVPRIVHVSIMNPERDPTLEYYRGKAALERDLRLLGVSHAVVRPGVLFGRGDILVNNIAWALRHLPVFGVPGDGAYAIQPMHVDDFADLVVEGALGEGGACVDAGGPETYTFRGLVEMLAGVLGVGTPIISVPPWVGYAVARGVGWWKKDVMLTREEVRGLMGGLLASAEPARGRIRLSEWASEHRETLGRGYASELARRRDGRRTPARP